MSTSGTATFNPSIIEIMEEAWERCGLELKAGYDIRTTSRSLNLLLAEWNSRGVNLWTVEGQVQLTLITGQAAYSLPVDTVDIVDASIRINPGNISTQTDTIITPISLVDYNQQTNKLTQGFPTQYFVQRGLAPKVYIWPTPDNSQTYYLSYDRIRRIQDAGFAGNTADVPFRFLNALISGLAYMVAVKKKPEMVSILKALYDESFSVAADADTQRTSSFILPCGYM